MSAMEYANLHVPAEQLCFVEELGEFCLETALSFQPNNLISPNEDGILMQRLMQIESELMDFNSTHEESVVNGDLLTEDNCQRKGNSLYHLLLEGAKAIEAENRPLASDMISKLNYLLSERENGDDPLSRLAIFFTQALLCKITNAPLLLREPVSTVTNKTMSAFQMLQELSPYVKFAHFTANQAILEASKDDSAVHIVDFDIMEGIQWPPLMVDLTVRKDACVRITAIVWDPQNESVVEHTGRRLKEFADSINLPFVFDWIVMEKEDDIDCIQVGHTLIANCMTHQLHTPNRGLSLVNTFLGGIAKLSPKRFVLVEEELYNFDKLPSMSFVEFFSEALQHYSAVSESLMSSFCGGYRLGLRVIENEFLGNKILDGVRNYPCGMEEKRLWEDGLPSLKGFRPIHMSSCNISQAQFLVGLFNVGFWVQREKCRLALCWKSRPLMTASVWVPISNSM